MLIDGNIIKFTAEMSGKQLVIKLNDLCLEIQNLKDYIVEYELLGDQVKPVSPNDDCLSIL